MVHNRHSSCSDPSARVTLPLQSWPAFHSFRERVKSLPWPVKLCTIYAPLPLLFALLQPPWRMHCTFALRPLHSLSLCLDILLAHSILTSGHCSNVISSLNSSPTTLYETITPTPTPGHYRHPYPILFLPKHCPYLKCWILLCAFAVCVSQC